ncbi:MAG: DUF3368 domain-containing protein [Spirochaetaceae bacterium]|jgi:predicted nucleic acid-binding protein|nr:DUF3368 domain-containing protein [Spirochaetaceae bacterium]
MRKVVSNTTPLISLLKIGKLDLLRLLYGNIFIPYAVYQEIEAGKDSFYTDLTALDWVSIERLHSTAARVFLYDLDDGEAEALMLAQELGADLILIDEKCARRYAQLMDIPVTGTLGILLRAKEKGFISEIAPLIKELQGNNTWFSPGLIAKILVLAGEVPLPC